MALKNVIDVLVRFAKRLAPYLDWIVSSVQHCLNTGLDRALGQIPVAYHRLAAPVW